MSAQELRDAAKVLRERAESVRAGANEPDMWFGVEELELALTYGDQAEMGDPRADAAYIATMHPGVGLTLADLLINESNAWDAMSGNPDVPPYNSARGDLLASVARAILGGQS